MTNLSPCFHLSFFKATFTVLRGTSKCVFNAGAIDKISSSGLPGPLGGNRMHVGSAKDQDQYYDSKDKPCDQYSGSI
jgi:hypothetical protein